MEKIQVRVSKAHNCCLIEDEGELYGVRLATMADVAMFNSDPARFEFRDATDAGDNLIERWLGQVVEHVFSSMSAARLRVTCRTNAPREEPTST
jgi:hypothetical protein